ncbi:hypothetical protein D3C81_157310 [compost metagenome]
MLYYPTDALYRQIISELPARTLQLPLSHTDHFRFCLRAFASGFMAGSHRSLLPEHWLAQQLRLVAYTALEQGGDLTDPSTQQWCLTQLTTAWDPMTSAGRVLDHAGARTPVFDCTSHYSAAATPGLPLAEALITGLNTLRSTWRLLYRLS